MVERLGRHASGPHAELVVICIPDGVDWGIAEYDGAEWVGERHRAWMPRESDVVGYDGVLQTPAAIVAPRNDKPPSSSRAKR
ncbi:hypothetical protein JOE61_001957 [Nocardioides salarius]|uniref:Uncharacterized protein n=1 Tax=Nocardioides salarius TaxID=374513 RepID=A0ABS2MAD5_9ACTN|nr:hypothetical protein [Nocardioides salarius]MBM7508143.1 hypothetical protein [Nocardioides salarius]